MTHDERIEAMARAMHRDECVRRDYPWTEESFDNLRDGVKDILLRDAAAAWAAADVESLVREAVEDAVEMFVAWAVNQSTPLGQPIDPPGIDAIVARVMQGAG
jgi:hypothetical protein